MQLWGSQALQLRSGLRCVQVPCATALCVRQVSERVLETDEPVIGKTKALMAGVEGVLSLAQGALPRLSHTACVAPLHTAPRTPSRCARQADQPATVFQHQRRTCMA